VGCCNPQFLDPGGGSEISVDALLARVRAAGEIVGLTLSGGEPFDQSEPLAVLCQQVRACGLNLVCFTGYALDELQGSADPAQLALLAELDLLVAGPFLEDQPCALPLVASANQRLHFLSDRLTPESLRELPRAEVIIRDGEVIVSGFDTAVSEALRDTENKEVL
jgi:anaerobic ribonucleoside-triphosphate reductase activating protein